MSGNPIDGGDMETLAAMLESEKLSHTRTRSVCFGMFVFCFGVLVVAIGVLTYLLIAGATSAAQDSLTYMQVLAPLGAMVVGFFTSWWTAQNCINSIDRTLFAARAGRHRLFMSFLEQLQCADKKKRRIMLDVVSTLVG